MLNVLQEGVPLGVGTSAYRDLKVVAGPLTIGRFVAYARNPSDGNRLALTYPSGVGAHVIGILGRNKLDIVQPRLRQTASPTDTTPAGTWAKVDAQTVADQEKAFAWANGGVYETDQVDTSSGTFVEGDHVTFQPTDGDDCGKALKMVYNGTSQKCGRCIGYSNGILRFQSLLA